MMIENFKAWRASIINPLSQDRLEYLEDGVCVSMDGRIIWIGSSNEFLRLYKNLEPDELDGVIMPGFVDIHCHWVQHRVQGVFAGELLDWLNNNIWPEEGNYSDFKFARQEARKFYSDMLEAGTLMGMSFSSVHQKSLVAAMEEMKGDWVIGNVLMAVNAPEYLIEHSMHEDPEFHDMVGDVDVKHYAVTPRFAPNMRQVDLKLAGRIASEYGFLVQTHLGESVAEVKWVRELFPDAENYTQVYDQAGLLGPRTVLAHCLHMENKEWECLAARGSWIAHCPSSNEALGNPLMSLPNVRKYDIPWAFGSDIGGGPSHSMLHVLQRFFDLNRRAKVDVSGVEAIYRATLAGAEAMGRANQAGNLQPGKGANFILMPGRPSSSALEGWLLDLCTGSQKELEKRCLGSWISGEQMLANLDNLSS